MDRRPSVGPGSEGLASDGFTGTDLVSDCLAGSCLKWGQDGELSMLDLQTILQRLSAVDEQAAGLLDCSVEPPLAG